MFLTLERLGMCYHAERGTTKRNDCGVLKHVLALHNLSLQITDQIYNHENQYQEKYDPLFLKPLNIAH